MIPVTLGILLLKISQNKIALRFTDPADADIVVFSKSINIDYVF